MGNRRNANHRPIKMTLKQNQKRYHQTGADKMQTDYQVCKHRHKITFANLAENKDLHSRQATDDEDDLRYPYEHFPPQDNTYG
jgi:hypothetical protein